MARKYDNFDLEIVPDGGAADGGYRARVRSPHGEAQASFSMPLSDQELRILGLTIARGRRNTRSVQHREVDEVKAYGQRLFDAVFTGDVLSCYYGSVSSVRGDAGRGLRVRLRLGGAPELAQIPWEYLFDRRSGRFLALDEETPIVRYLDLPMRAAALQVEPPLRVLVMIAGPSDVPGLDADEEWRLLHDALDDLVSAGAVELHRLERATISALRWRLKADDYHVFHFIGHGGVDAITDRGVLLLEDDAGRTDAVEAEVIAGVLSGERTLRLAVLNACEGGRASKGDIFAGTAQALVQQDVPAVIAMQFEISDQAAIALTHDFYKALAFGDPVDAALTEARRGLRFELRNELEWGTPVLYMRASDGRLFDVTGPPKPVPPAAEPDAGPTRERDPVAPGHTRRGGVTDEAEPVDGTARQRERRIAELLHSANVAAFAEQWADATARLEQVLELDAGNADATTRLGEIRREEQLAVLFRTGTEHEAAGRHAEAIDAFTRARRLAGTDYRGIDARVDALRARRKEARQPRTLFGIRVGRLGIAVTLGMVAVFALMYDEFSYMFDDGGWESATDVAPPFGGATASGGGTAPSRDAEAAALGLSPVGTPIVGSLQPGGWTVHDVMLEGGSSYVIAGSCDLDCNVLDLAIGEQGMVRFQDVALNAVPVLAVPVLSTGYYQVSVTMRGCGAGSCGYRVQLYR